METPGSLIDKLSIVNLKLWHQEEIAHDPKAVDFVVAAAKRKIDGLNLQRNALVQELDELFRDVVEGRKLYPVVPQFKDYSRK
jgi:cell division protein FtsB